MKKFSDDQTQRNHCNNLSFLSKFFLQTQKDGQQLIARVELVSQEASLFP